MVVEQHVGEVVHAVTLLGVEHVVGEHGVEHGSGERHTVAHEHLHVVFYVLPDFQYFGAFIERFEYVNNSLSFFTFCWHSHVKRLVRLDGKA